jgi:hypothetical protein
MAPDRDDRSGSPDPDVDALFAQIVAGWDDEQTSPVPPWPATEDLPERTGPDPAGQSGTRRETGDRTDRRPGDDGREGSSPDADTPDDGAPPRGDRPDPRVSGRRGIPGAGVGPQSHDRRRSDTPRDPNARPGRHAMPGPEPTARPASGHPPSGADSPAPPGPPAPGPRDWAAADEPDEGFVPPEPPPLPRGDLVGRLAWAGVLLGPAFLLLSALVWDDAGPLPLALATLAFVGGFITLVARMPARRDDEDDDGAVV